MCDQSQEINHPSVELNTTFTHVIDNVSFGNLSKDVIFEFFKDGRPFAHFIEPWLSENYPLQHVTGCKKYDFLDPADSSIIYDEKTFTKGGCCFRPSNMLGQGRKFDKTVFEEKTKKLIFCIVSNVNFPEIKVKFVKGTDLLVKYPSGKIPLKEHVEFFN